MINLRKAILVCIAPACIASLSGCSTLFGEEGVFRGKQKDYLRSGSINPISVPEGMTSANLAPLYVIPQVEARDDFGDNVSLTEYEVPQPQGANTEKGEVGVKLQRIAEDKWIFLSASTSQVWPRTQNFLTRFGIPVVAANPAIGLIETGDVKFKDDDENMSRFKIYIQKGIHPETTEVHLVQTQYPIGGDTSAIQWHEQSVNVEKEYLLLDELAGVLAESVNNNSASLLGQNVGGDVKVDFVLEGSEPAMRLRLPLVRARATVAHALNREGFKVWDESADTGVYYVAFDDDFKADRGWLGRLFHDDLPEKPRYPLQDVMQHLSSSSETKKLFGDLPGVAYGEPLKKLQGYLVVMTDSPKGMDVFIRDARGETIERAEAKSFLRLIRKNLI